MAKSFADKGFVRCCRVHEAYWSCLSCGVSATYHTSGFGVWAGISMKKIYTVLSACSVSELQDHRYRGQHCHKGVSRIKNTKKVNKSRSRRLECFYKSRHFSHIKQKADMMVSDNFCVRKIRKGVWKRVILFDSRWQ